MDAGDSATCCLGASVPGPTCPCLIPNPGNPNMPQLVWDVLSEPTTAQRITGAHTISPLLPSFTNKPSFPPRRRYTSQSSRLFVNVCGFNRSTTKSTALFGIFCRRSHFFIHSPRRLLTIVSFFSVRFMSFFKYTYAGSGAYQSL